MSALFKLPLAPFAALFRFSFANPMLAILASAALGLGALVIGQPNWMAVLLCFSAYILIWWSESETAAALPVAAEK